MKLAVTAETTIDLTPALLKEFDIRTIPLGITLEVLANVTILPGEGIVKTLSAKGGWEFGNVKVAFDCTLTAIASVIAFITFGRLNGVGIGTLVSALAVGQLVKLYSRCIKRSAARRAGGGAVQ